MSISPFIIWMIFVCFSFFEHVLLSMPVNKGGRGDEKTPQYGIDENRDFCSQEKAIHGNMKKLPVVCKAPCRNRTVQTCRKSISDLPLNDIHFRSAFCPEDSIWSSKSSECQDIEIVGNVIANNEWIGQFKRKHQTSGKIDLFDCEIYFFCDNTLLIHVYLTDAPNILSQNIQQKSFGDQYAFNVTFERETGLQVVVNITKTSTFRFDIKLPQRHSVFQVIQLNHNTILSSEMIILPDTDVLQNREISSNKYCVEQKIGRKIYNYTDGTEILEIIPGEDYIYGGYVFPFDTLCFKTERKERNLSVTITLDESNNAEGDINISGHNEKNSFIHLKIQLIRGHYLTIHVIPNEEFSEPMYLNTITVYGLFGYPNSFVIDKGKEYRLEDNLPHNRCIDNVHRIPVDIRNIGMLGYELPIKRDLDIYFQKFTNGHKKKSYTRMDIFLEILVRTNKNLS